MLSACFPFRPRSRRLCAYEAPPKQHERARIGPQTQESRRPAQRVRCRTNGFARRSRADAVQSNSLYAMYMKFCDFCSGTRERFTASAANVVMACTFLERKTGATFLLLVTLSLQKLSLLVLAHLLAALLDDTTHVDSPCVATNCDAGPCLETRSWRVKDVATRSRKPLRPAQRRS